MLSWSQFLAQGLKCPGLKAFCPFGCGNWAGLLLTGSSGFGFEWSVDDFQLGYYSGKVVFRLLGIETFQEIRYIFFPFENIFGILVFHHHTGDNPTPLSDLFQSCELVKGVVQYLDFSPATFMTRCTCRPGKSHRCF